MKTVNDKNVIGLLNEELRGITSHHRRLTVMIILIMLFVVHRVLGIRERIRLNRFRVNHRE